jgi:hypothetical protein
MRPLQRQGLDADMVRYSDRSASSVKKILADETTLLNSAASNAKSRISLPLGICFIILHY